MAKSKNLADEKQTGLFWRPALTLFKNPIEWNHFSWIIILGCKWTLKIVFMNTFVENNPWFYYTHNTSLSVLCRQYIGSVVGVLSIYNFEEDLRPIFSKFKTVKKKLSLNLAAYLWSRALKQDIYVISAQPTIAKIA